MVQVQGLQYRLATVTDAPLVTGLVNGAYRGDGSRLGWTTEADLLGGQRTDTAAVTALLGTDDSLILLAERDTRLIGCLHLSCVGEEARLGMFSVDPRLQGRGIGKAMLAEAERQASARFGARRLCMAVICHRTELIAYYLRRGYRRTERHSPFPDDPRYGIPKVEQLRMVWLEKAL